MIHSIGSDLVSIQRIKEMDLERFKDKILSEDEKIEFSKITHINRKLTYLAGRFAAKEALFKCFKEGDKTANYKDFSVLNGETGAPYVVSKHTQNYNVFITLSHTDEYAIAFIILEVKV